MRITRRRMLGMGGGLAAALFSRPATVWAANPIEIVMAGREDGSHVWFDPIGLLIQPGQTVRWIMDSPGTRTRPPRTIRETGGTRCASRRAPSRGTPASS